MSVYISKKIVQTQNVNNSLYYNALMIEVSRDIKVDLREIYILQNSMGSIDDPFAYIIQTAHNTFELHFRRSKLQQYIQMFVDWLSKHTGQKHISIITEDNSHPVYFTMLDDYIYQRFYLHKGVEFKVDGPFMEEHSIFKLRTIAEDLQLRLDKFEVEESHSIIDHDGASVGLTSPLLGFTAGIIYKDYFHIPSHLSYKELHAGYVRYIQSHKDEVKTYLDRDYATRWIPYERVELYGKILDSVAHDLGTEGICRYGIFKLRDLLQYNRLVFKDGFGGVLPVGYYRLMSAQMDMIYITMYVAATIYLIKFWDYFTTPQESTALDDCILNKCSERMNAITLEELVKYSHTVYFFEHGRMHCYDRDAFLQGIFKTTADKFALWIPNEPGRHIEPMGYGGHPDRRHTFCRLTIGGFQRFIHQYVNNKDVLSKELKYGEYLAFDLVETSKHSRIGNIEGVFGVGNIHGQVPGYPTYRLVHLPPREVKRRLRECLE